LVASAGSKAFIQKLNGGEVPADAAETIIGPLAQGFRKPPSPGRGGGSGPSPPGANPVFRPTSFDRSRLTSRCPSHKPFFCSPSPSGNQIPRRCSIRCPFLFGSAPPPSRPAGQFGVGFYSTFMVASEVKVYTRSQLKGAAGYLWRSDGCAGAPPPGPDSPIPEVAGPSGVARHPSGPVGQPPPPMVTPHRVGQEGRSVIP